MVLRREPLVRKQVVEDGAGERKPMGEDDGRLPSVASCVCINLGAIRGSHETRVILRISSHCLLSATGRVLQMARNKLQKKGKMGVGDVGRRGEGG